MMWFVTRRRFNAEIAALRGYNDALRERCELAEKNEATERVARRTITRQHADVDAANRRLMGRNLELGRRLSALTESDPEYAGRLERRITRLLKVAARLYSGGHAERLRADHLQQRLDDALSLNDPAVTAGELWQKRRDDKRGMTKEATS